MVRDERNNSTDGPLDEADVIDTEFQQIDLDTALKIDSLFKGDFRNEIDKRPPKHRRLFNVLAVVIGIAMFIGLVVTLTSGKDTESKNAIVDPSADVEADTSSDVGNSGGVINEADKEEPISPSFDLSKCSSTTLTCPNSNSDSMKTWSPLQSEIVGDNVDDMIGLVTALSCDGSKIAVAYPGSNAAVGHVRVYEMNEKQSNWTQLGNDIVGADKGIKFGASLSMSADGLTLAIGSYEGDKNGENSGHVRVYEYFDHIWFEVGQEIQGEAANDRSGRSVSLSADASRLAIGATGNNINGTKFLAGQLCVYELDKNKHPYAWKKIGQDLDGEETGDQFGRSVAFSGDGRRLAAGGPTSSGKGGDGNSGHVRVFEFVPDINKWTQIGADIDGNLGDWLGYSVSMSFDGSIVAIGAPRDIDSFEGDTRVYKLSNGNWIQMGSSLEGGGKSVAMTLNGDRVITASYEGFNNGTNSGHAFVYDFNGTEWNQVGDDLHGKEGDRFGTSVAISADGNRIVSSSPMARVGEQGKLGRVQVFDFC